jgi:hypothetical protein
MSSHFRSSARHTVGAPWSSNLSVAEFAAIRMIGFEPVGFVVGASVYRFGEQLAGRRLRYRPWYGITGTRMVASMRPMPQNTSLRLPRACEEAYEQTYRCQHRGPGHVPGVNYEDLSFEAAVSESFNDARERLRTEVSRLGCDGVVGVRVAVDRPRLRTMAPTSEMRLTGTAVRRQGGAGASPPFTSNLSGQAFAKLVVGGWMPVDTVIGIGVVRSFFGCVGSPQDPFGRREFTQRSDAIQMSREIAVARLGSGPTPSLDSRMVGLETIGPFGRRRDTLFEYSIVGTSVVRLRATQSELPDVALTLGAR